MSSAAAATPTACRWCGEAHGPLCPAVKALEFDPFNGVVTRVEFVTIADFPQRREQQEEPPGDYPRLGAKA